MPIKATSRSKKTAEITVPEENGMAETVTVVKTTAKTDPFTLLIKEVTDLQSESDRLQKAIAQTKEAWISEQKARQQEIEQRNSLEELNRKREQETYEYETARKRKKEEDEFTDQKTSWEKNLKEQQEVLEKERAELLELRKLVAEFDGEKEKVVAEAQEVLQKELVTKFETERKLREQEQKSEKDLLNLKIANLTGENNKLNTEIEVLKKTLEEATKQVKDIAVKVIESGTKPQSSDVAP